MAVVTPAGIPREGSGTVKHEAMYARTGQKVCGCLGHRSGMCANSKDLLIVQTSDMLTSSGGVRQLTLLCSYSVWQSCRSLCHLRTISSGWSAERA